MNDDLLVKFLAGEAEPAERQAVEQWIRESEDNARHYNHFKAIWENSESLALKTTVSEDDAWERFRTKVILKDNQGGEQRGKVRLLNSWLRVAAAIVLVTVAGSLAVTYYLDNRPVTLVQLKSGQHTLSDTLPDGSVITLNRNSRFSYPSRFTGTRRNVTLQGEAFFKVAADKSRPFTITVDDVTVTVVGTSFNIKSRGEQTEVIVESGIVQVAKDNDKVELRAGEKVLAGEKGVLSKGFNTNALYNSYMSKIFVCRNTPLSALISAVNDAYNADIEIANKSLESLPLNNTFRNDSVENILQVLAETFTIKIEREGQKIILK